MVLRRLGVWRIWTRSGSEVRGRVKDIVLESLHTPHSTRTQLTARLFNWNRKALTTISFNRRKRAGDFSKVARREVRSSAEPSNYTTILPVTFRYSEIHLSETSVPSVGTWFAFHVLRVVCVETVKDDSSHCI